MERFFEFVGNHPILVGALIGLLFLLWMVERAKAGRLVTTHETTKLVNAEKAVILDIRDKKDFSEGRITGSIHIPLTSLKDRSSELEKYKDKDIIIVDKLGQHSSTAGKTLKEAGFENVLRLTGGIGEWTSSNLPLVKK